MSSTESELGKATVSSIIWKLLERGGYQLVSLVVQIVMARLLAPEEFGALAIILVFVNIGNVFVQSGLPTALVQTPVLHEKDASTVFWFSLIMSMVLYMVVFMCAPLIAAFYSMPEIVWPLRVMELWLPITALNSVQVALVQRMLKFRKVFNATLVAVFFSAIAGVGTAVAGGGLWALVVQQLVFQLVSCIALSAQISWRPRLEFDPHRAKHLFSFGWKLLLSGLLDTGYQSLSDLIVGKQFSASSLGLISQGKKYPAAVGQLLDGAIQPVMLSTVAQVQSDLDRVKGVVRRALKTSTFLIVPSMTLFGIAAEPIVSLLLGEQWLPCVPFLQMYCFIYALLPIHTTNLQALNGLGRSDLFLKLELIKKTYGVCFLLFATFVLHDVYLLVGSYMVTGIISTFVNAWPNKRLIGYTYGEQVRDIAPAFLLAALAGVLSFLVGGLVGNEVLKIIVEVLTMACSYLCLSALLHLDACSYLVDMLRSLLVGKQEAHK